jgi:streptogramin lyase
MERSEQHFVDDGNGLRKTFAVASPMRHRVLLFLAHGITALLPAAAQPNVYHVRHFSTAEGLSHRQVNAMVQDEQGFLWVATEAGLDRYDGYSFKHWDTRTGLSPGPVSRLCLDGQGWLWAAHHGSEGHLLDVDLVNARSGEVSSLAKRFSEGIDPRTLMGDFITDQRGGVWCFSRKGELLRFVADRLERRPVRWPGDPPEPQPQMMDITPNGHVWCVLGKGTIVELGADGTFLRSWDVLLPTTPRVFRTRPSKAGQSSYFIRANNSGVGDLWRIDEQEGPVILGPLHDDLFDNYGRCVRLDLPDGTYVEHSLVLDAEGRTLFDIATDHPHIRYRVLCGFVDPNGKAWIGGDFGLYLLEVRPNRFQRWLYDEAIQQGYGKRCRGMTEWNGRLYVNTELEGYYALSLKDGSILDHQKPQRTGFVLSRDEHAGRWVDGQEFLFHIDTEGVEKVYRCGWETWSILTDPREGVLLGQRQGIMRLDTISGTCTSYARYNDFPELAGAFIMRMERDLSGNVWLCTDMGLYRMEPGKGVLERFWTGGDATHKLPDDDIHHITHDHGGTYWISTASSGLLRWDRASNSLQRWGREEGLLSNTIHAAYPDREGYVWMPTENGIARLDPRTGSITSFGTVDGITHQEFNRISHTRLTDGRLCFGGLNGITVFDPLAVNTTALIMDHPLVMTGFEQYDADSGKVIDRSRELQASGRIVVNPGDRSLRLDVALLTFDEPGRLRYAWQVEGYHPQWNEQQAPSILPGDLPYGEWVLHVRGRDASGHWSNNTLSYTLKVVPPLHMRWWFILACLIVFIGVVMLIFRSRLNRQLAVMRMRDRIAMDLHDEVGGTLSRLALFADTANATDPELRPTTRKLLDRISTNSSAALEAMNDIVWAVNTGNDSGQQLVDRMRGVAVQASEAIACTLQFDADPGVERIRLSMEQRRDIYLLYKEAVNNAVKHSGCSVLRVDLFFEDKELVLRVIDNGKGFEQDGRTAPGRLSGNGSINMQRRAHGLGGHLHVTSAPHAGTQVQLRFPI